MTTCAGCGKPILGNYINALGKSWHAEHFVCAGCGRVIGRDQFYVKDGQPYCREDYLARFVMHCSVCGQPIEGSYVENYWKEPYCARHRTEYRMCESCGRPVVTTAGGVHYPGGIGVCGLCSRTALVRNTLVDRLSEELKLFFYSRLKIEFTQEHIPVLLVDFNILTRESIPRSALSGLAKVVKTVVDGRTVAGAVDQILVLKGLPYEVSGEILAHELLHAYMAIENYPQMSHFVEEGLSQLASYLWLESVGTPLARYRMQLLEGLEDPIYGQGFRSARQAMQGRTFLQLMAYVRARRALPG